MPKYRLLAKENAKRTELLERALDDVCACIQTVQDVSIDNRYVEGKRGHVVCSVTNASLKAMQAAVPPARPDMSFEFRELRRTGQIRIVMEPGAKKMVSERKFFVDTTVLVAASLILLTILVLFW
jgi:hypothetical protein